MNYLLTVAFDGKDFCGWQFQPGERTVQGVITEVSERLFKCKCLVTGCSRTDSGVHALGFRCTVKPSDPNALIPAAKLPYAYSSLLPCDVSVLAACEVADDFHPRYTDLVKEYEYRVHNSPIPDPFTVGRAFRFPAPITDEGIENMRRAAELICGTHDFTSFMASGSKITDAVRTVHFCRVERRGDIIYVNVAADGFLYNMVRIIVGTLLEVGRGELAPENVEGIIASRDRRMAGSTAPACGLYLKNVVYNG
ncbi:MAG: tRNA pseudouridine(38-40) synthase TruA [Clostridia bacterium]|nr:tRNA pseudouridine(38-40) synthase TruA [Clostridia bacterium]